MPRIRTPYVGDSYDPMPGARRMGDLLRYGAGQSAEYEMERGRIAASLGQNLAQIAGQTIGGITQHYAEQPQREAQAKLTKLQLEEAQAASDSRKTLSKNDQALSALFAGDTLPDPKAIIRVVGPKRGAEIIQALSALSKDNAEAFDTKQELVRDVVRGLDALSPALRESTYPTVLNGLVQRGILTPEDIPEGGAYDEAWHTRTVKYGFEPKVIGTREIKTKAADGTETIQIVSDTPDQTFTSAPEIKKHKVTVAGPNGPIDKLVPESELEQGVPAYERPRESQAPTTRYSRAPVTMPDGTEKVANYDATTGKYYDVDTGQVLTGVGQAPTADMRNREVGKRTAARAVEAVRTLGEGIITKVGPAQRADAIARGAAAVFGNDPEFRTYQDSRMALAGTLAVEQQGARVSDADVKALWLPMVPDAYRDTKESYKLKWDLINAMRGVADTPPRPPGPAKVNPFRKP